MTSQELKLKVINAEATVEKKANIVKKHRDQLSKLIAKGADAYDIRYKEQDIREAEKKLAEARKILDNWQAKLTEKITQDEYLAANTPAVLVEFLDNWKARVTDYYLRAYANFVEFKKDIRRREREARLEALRTLPELERYRELYFTKLGRTEAEISDNDLANLWPRNVVDEFLSERGLEYHQIRKAVRAQADMTILKMAEYRDPAERAAWLEKALEEDRRAKLLDLMARITKVVGRITDAAALYIGDTGEINGVVIGTEGRATVQTIGAGGYNIQIFHYRTLVHEIKK